LAGEPRHHLLQLPRRDLAGTAAAVRVLSEPFHGTNSATAVVRLPQGGVPMTDPRRLVPRTDTVLADPRLVDAATTVGRARGKARVAAARAAARRGETPPEAVADTAAANVLTRPASLRPVINATGVVVHTNLGRAPLSESAVDAIRAAAGYTDVELDL